MREADSEVEYYEMILYYCKAILNAENEEEVEVIKEDIVKSLQEQGLDEVAIDQFLTNVNNSVEAVESEKATVEDYENQLEAFKESYEAETVQEVPANVSPTIMTGAGVGIGLGILVGCFALRKKTLKNKKSKGL